MKNKFRKEDKSPRIPQRNKIKNTVEIRKSNKLTEKQQCFLDLASDKDTKLIFVSGPAGTSKTYLAVLVALQLLNEKKVSDIMYIRSAVESCDSKLGYLPGTSEEKMSPYIQPLIDKLEELLSPNDVKHLIDDERISSVPVGYLRGLNWNAKVIITDEAQNMSFKELTTLVTRVGEFNKTFIIGDLDQCDIGNRSGFNQMISCFSDEDSRLNGIYTFEFTEEDIVRSALVKFIVKKLKNVVKKDSK